MVYEKSINLFGLTEVVSGSRTVSEFTTVHCRNLLAFLALNADTDHPRERLIEVLWPGNLGGSTRNRLSVTLYHLRRTLAQLEHGLDDVILISKNMMRIDSSEISIDYLEFCGAIKVARRSNDQQEKSDAYTKALKLYSDPLLVDVNADWSVTKQFEASQAFHEAALWTARLADDTGDADTAKLVLSEALKAEPSSERSAELLVNWYTQGGEPELAIACAKRLRSALAAQGRTLSRAMHDHISELNLILTDRPRAIAFADEMTLCVLSFGANPTLGMKRMIEQHGGRESTTDKCWLFNNSVQALEAGMEILIDAPDVSALIHTTIMSEQDDPPSICSSAHRVIQKGELLSTEASMQLLKARGMEPKTAIDRTIRFYKYS